MTKKRMEWLWQAWFRAPKEWMSPRELTGGVGFYGISIYYPDTHAALEQTWAMFQGLA